MRIDLHIDRLVLHGFPESDGATVAAALRARLSELISSDPPPWSDAGRVNAGEYRPGATAGQTGASIADSVHKGLSGGSRS